MRAALALLLLSACSYQEVSKFNSAPTVTLIAPTDGAYVDPDGLVEFIAQVGDAQTASENLVILWQSDVDGTLDETPADANGQVYFATNTLSSGPQVVTLTVADEGGKTASASVGIIVAQGSTSVGDPVIELLNPVDGAILLSTESHNVIATVEDDKDAPSTLVADVLDVPDGMLWSGNPSATGNISVPWNFSIGTHHLSITVLDADGNTGEVSSDFEVVDGGRPTISIQSPSDGATFDTTLPITFEGQVADDFTAVEDLVVEWSSDLQGPLSTNPADSSGRTTFSTFLVGGVHTITLSVTDTDGKQARETILLHIDDPLSRDDDGDGLTENEGDCDDDNPLVNPDMVETCDGSDNNCDGLINENDQDPYEANETIDASYDFGQVGSGFWSDQTVSLAGLTLHEDADSDWFMWNTGDVFILDNVSINLTVTGLPANGNYVVELYNLGSGNVVDSDSGSGTLRVQYTGDIFDDNEADWAVHIYAATWPSNSCATTYTLTISC